MVYMHRVKKLWAWKRKRPYEGQSKSKSGYCLSDHWHQSGLEIKVCDELRLRLIAKDFVGYGRQIPFTLMDGDVNVSQYIGRYIADFVIQHHDGSQEIVEAKGIRFPTFKKKWKVLEKMYKNDPKMTLTIIEK